MAIKNKVILPAIPENDKKLPLYIAGVGCWYRERIISRPAGYPNYQWIQCHDGEGRLIIYEKTYPVKAGQGMLLFPNVPHEYYETKKNWTVDWINWNGCEADALVKYTGLDQSGVYNVSHSDILLSNIRRAFNVLTSTDPLKGPQCSIIMYEILIDLLRYASKDTDSSVFHQYTRLEPVFTYIENNYYKEFSMEDLAGTIDVTPQHLCLLFKRALNERPFEYINKVRINKSKALLLSEENYDINTISKMVGYSGVNYYSSVFKRIEGTSPGNFKKLYTQSGR